MTLRCACGHVFVLDLPTKGYLLVLLFTQATCPRCGAGNRDLFLCGPQRAGARRVTQLPLLDEIAREERPWKVVRKVSKQVYAELRDKGYTKQSARRVLTALAWYRNSTMQWPTASELTAFMANRKRITRNESRIVAPRLTEMLRGCVVKQKDGSKRRIGGGVLTLLPARVCRVSGKRAHPVAIREAGSLERQAA